MHSYIIALISGTYFIKVLSELLSCQLYANIVPRSVIGIFIVSDKCPDNNHFVHEQIHKELKTGLLMSPKYDN